MTVGATVPKVISKTPPALTVSVLKVLFPVQLTLAVQARIPLVPPPTVTLPVNVVVKPRRFKVAPSRTKVVPATVLVLALNAVVPESTSTIPHVIPTLTKFVPVKFVVDAELMVYVIPVGNVTLLKFKVAAPLVVIDLVPPEPAVMFPFSVNVPVPTASVIFLLVAPVPNVRAPTSSAPVPESVTLVVLVEVVGPFIVSVPDDVSFTPVFTVMACRFVPLAPASATIVIAPTVRVFSSTTSATPELT
jgi:hypothetical protein